MVTVHAFPFAKRLFLRCRCFADAAAILRSWRGADLAAGAAFADHKISGCGLVRQVVASGASWINDHVICLPFTITGE